MTSRERNLLFVVISIILVAVFYFFAYRPITADLGIEEAEINKLNNELNDLTIEYIKKDEYLTEIDDMNTYINKIDERFPGDISQELIIYTLLDIEGKIDSLSIPSYTMTVPEVVLTNGETKDETSGELIYNDVLTKTQAQLNLSMTYEDMKKMLAYIRNSDSKLSVNGMNMSSDLVTDMVSLSFNLDFYALHSLDRVYVPQDLFGPFEPKENPIFMPYDGYGASFDPGISDDLNVVTEPSDFTLNLSTIYADRETIILYNNLDMTGDSYLRADSNKPQPLELVFEQNGQNYTYKYKTTGVEYPVGYANGAAFDPGQVIGLTVYSSSKVDGDDNSGVDVTVINNTDLPVDIEVIADDLDNPRFNLVSTSGTINIVN